MSRWTVGRKDASTRTNGQIGLTAPTVLVMLLVADPTQRLHPCNAVGGVRIRSMEDTQMPDSWTVEARWPLRRARVRPNKWLPKGKSEFYVKCRSTYFGLRARSWAGIAVVTEWEPGTLPGLGRLPRRQWEYPQMGIKKRSVQVQDTQHLAAVESTYFTQLLPLVEHCALLKYDDGTPRQPGWFTIKTNGQTWVVQVKDPDSCSSFNAVGESLDKALETAALLLSCDSAPWERDRFLVDSQARTKKK